MTTKQMSHSREDCFDSIKKSQHLNRWRTRVQYLQVRLKESGPEVRSRLSSDENRNHGFDVDEFFPRLSGTFSNLFFFPVDLFPILEADRSNPANGEQLFDLGVAALAGRRVSGLESSRLPVFDDHLPDVVGLVHGVDNDPARAGGQPTGAIEPVFSFNAAVRVRDDAALFVVRNSGLHRNALVADAPKDEAALDRLRRVRGFDGLVFAGDPSAGQLQIFNLKIFKLHTEDGGESWVP